MNTPEPTSIDRVIDAYKHDIDRSLLRENLRLSPEERILKLMAFLRLVNELQHAKRKPQ